MRIGLVCLAISIIPIIASLGAIDNAIYMYSFAL